MPGLAHAYLVTESHRCSPSASAAPAPPEKPELYRSRTRRSWGRDKFNRQGSLSEPAEDPARSADQSAHACTLAATLTPPELLELDAAGLLHRLFHQDPVHLFEPNAVRFRCNCSRQRTLNALSALDPAEMEELLVELGSITMDCEFCNQQYRFTREDLAVTLGTAEPKTLH
jgi:hypothetical protein